MQLKSKNENTVKYICTIYIKVKRMVMAKVIIKLNIELTETEVKIGQTWGIYLQNYWR